MGWPHLQYVVRFHIATITTHNVTTLAMAVHCSSAVAFHYGSSHGTSGGALWCHYCCPDAFPLTMVVVKLSAPLLISSVTALVMVTEPPCDILLI